MISIRVKEDRKKWPCVNLNWLFFSSYKNYRMRKEHRYSVDFPRLPIIRKERSPPVVWSEQGPGMQADSSLLQNQALLLLPLYFFKAAVSSASLRTAPRTIVGLLAIWNIIRTTDRTRVVSPGEGRSAVHHPAQTGFFPLSLK